MKIKLVCLIVLGLGLTSGSASWARGGHHGGGHGGGHHVGGHHHYGGGFYPGYAFGAYGLGLGMGYGLGYYGGFRYGGYGGWGGYGGYGGYGYGAPYYAYPPVVAVPTAPQIYIQQQQPQPQQAVPQPQINYWHYCRNPEGYYPYVKKCPDGWLQVAPQPSSQN